MPCKVCGNPETVRSHLLPRAFVKDTKGDHQAAFQGSSSSQGTILTQCGDFDPDLLCEAHEKSLQLSDDYAVRWVRNFRKNATLRSDLEDKLFEVANPRPDLLLHFVCSVVWRHAASDRFKENDGLLGPFEAKLRSMIFQGAKYDPAFCISKRDLTVGDQPFDPPIIISPHRNPQWGARGWEFELGGFIWSLKLDSRARGAIPSVMMANGKNPVLVANLPPLPAVERNGFVEIFANMRPFPKERRV